MTTAVHAPLTSRNQPTAHQVRSYAVIPWPPSVIWLGWSPKNAKVLKMNTLLASFGKSAIRPVAVLGADRAVAPTPSASPKIQSCDSEAPADPVRM